MSCLAGCSINEVQLRHVDDEEGMKWMDWELTWELKLLIGCGRQGVRIFVWTKNNLHAKMMIHDC